MGMWVGIGRKARRCYGFDEVAIVPGSITLDPCDVSTQWRIGDLSFNMPIIAAAMDGAVDVKFAAELGRLGGLAVLNLEGIQTRYESDQKIKSLISSIIGRENATETIQEIYKEPIKEELIHSRIQEFRNYKFPYNTIYDMKLAVSCTPVNAYRFSEIAQKAGADIFVVQSTVTTPQHFSRSYTSLNFASLRKSVSIPLIVGNVVSYKTAYDFMELGIDGILVGIGPGAACTTRGVLGLGVPQVTSTADVAAARDLYYKKYGRWVSVITDGGMTCSGDICKAFASGADAVMIGSLFTQALEAPGQGHHWGMAMPHNSLPRGTKIKTGVSGTIDQILYGPSTKDDGTQNLVGALRTCMGNCGAANIREMQMVELIIAPSIKTEGKSFQRNQGIGMGK